MGQISCLVGRCGDGHVKAVPGAGIDKCLFAAQRDGDAAPPSLCEASATSGSYMVSCLLPKPPPKKGFTTRTSPSGIPMASAMLRRSVWGT